MGAACAARTGTADGGCKEMAPRHMAGGGNLLEDLMMRACRVVANRARGASAPAPPRPRLSTRLCQPSVYAGARELYRY